MRTTTTALLCMALAACGGEPAEEAPETIPTPEHNTLTDAERESGWELLFDGETTSGWRAYGGDAFPEHGWSVEDGQLISVAGDPEADTGGEDLVTTQTFTDFDLRFEFNVTPVGNSGIFIRVIENDEPIWWNAPEYQVMDDSAYAADGWTEEHMTGVHYAIEGAAVNVFRRAGEWNEGRIVVDDGRVEHWLNGAKLVEYELGSPEWAEQVAGSKFAEFPKYGTAESGPIGIQDHGTRVTYRNIKIRRLDEESVGVSLFNGHDLEGWQVHGTELWYVEDGELVCESGPDAEYGYLSTEQQYTDFELTLEFEQEADGNSGVFFRSSIEGVRITGWQAEVAPPGLFTGGIYESYGRGWLIQPEPERDSALRMGEWNTMRVRVVGDRVTTWLNDVEMIDLTDEKIGEATGSIALQIHDGGGIKVRWRNLRVMEL